MKNVIIYCLFCVLSLFFSGYAYSYTITFNGDTSGFYIDYHRDKRDLVGIAGQKNITLEGFESVAYCIELGTPYGDGEISLIDLNSYDPFGSEWNQYGSYDNHNNGVHAAWLMDQYSTGLNDYSGDKDILDVSLQIAIWYTLYNYNPNDHSFDDEYFHNNIFENDGYALVPGVISPELSDGGDYDNYADGYKEAKAWSIAESYWTTMQEKDKNNSLNFSGNYEFFAAEIININDRSQTQLIARSTTHTPEPTTLVLFGMGLLGLAKITRRRY